MANLTFRNIPDSVLEQIKTLSTLDRRSMNGEILVLLEHAVRSYQDNSGRFRDQMVSPETQVEIWGGTVFDPQRERRLVDRVPRPAVSRTIRPQFVSQVPIATPPTSRMLKIEHHTCLPDTLPLPTQEGSRRNIQRVKIQHPLSEGFWGGGTALVSIREFSTHSLRAPCRTPAR